MKDIVRFYIPLTLPQAEHFVGSAYTRWLVSDEPCRGFLKQDDADREAWALAKRDGIGFVLWDSVNPALALPDAFDFVHINDVAASPLQTPEQSRQWVASRRLFVYRGENFPFRRVSLAGTERVIPHIGSREKPLPSAVADALDAAGFYELDAVFPEETPWYSPMLSHEWVERFHGALARRCHLDDEDASECGFRHVWSRAQPFLARLPHPPILRYIASTDEESVVCLDDTEYAVFAWDELGKHNPHWRYWTFETERLIRVLQLALHRRGVTERCYHHNAGNSSEIAFLTDAQAKILIDCGDMKAPR